MFLCKNKKKLSYIEGSKAHPKMVKILVSTKGITTQK